MILLDNMISYSMAQPSIEHERDSLKARKFMMWLFLVSSFIYFAGLTSGFIVYTAGDPSRGIKFILPDVFKFSTLAIVLSSVTMHLAYLSAKKEQISKQNLYLGITILLGLAFFVLQVQAWGIMFNQGVPFVNINASHSFVYVFTASHLLHILVGIILLLHALRG